MVKFIDRTKMTLSGAAGTGNLTFGSAVSGFQGLTEASVVDGDIVRYTIEDGTSYESGTGTIGLSGGTYTMARSPTSSTLANNGAITVGAAGVVIFTMLAQDVVQYLADIANVDSTTPAHGQALTFVSSTNSWAPVAPSGGISQVANYAALPASPSATDLAWTQDTKTLYIWDGLEWDRVSTGSQFAPRFTTLPPSTFQLNTDGSTSSITIAAVDDAGFPIIYDWDAFDSSGNVYGPSNLPDMVTNIAISNGVYTFTPSTNTAHEGDLVFRFRISDGIATAVSVSSMILSFTEYVAVPALTRAYANRVVQTYSAVSEVRVDHTHYNFNGGMTYQGPLRSGKGYTEIEIMTGHTCSASDFVIGIGDHDGLVADTYGYNSAHATAGPLCSIFHPGGNYGARATIHNASVNSYDQGFFTTTVNFSLTPGVDVLQVAWDTDAKKVWWGWNNTWNNATGDPLTGAGYSLGGVVDRFSLFAANKTTSTRDTLYKIICGPGSTLNYTAPSGFNRQ